jgi:hypothetical protein
VILVNHFVELAQSLDQIGKPDIANYAITVIQPDREVFMPAWRWALGVHSHRERN